MIIRTERTRLEILGPEDAYLMLKYYSDNKNHLSSWESDRGKEFYTLRRWKWYLSASQEMLARGTGVRFAVMDHDRNEVIGVCNFTGIVRNGFQACYLGFSVAEKYQGLGYMPEILDVALDYMFREMNLHRIMANYIPDNTRAASVLKKTGFKKEGFAESYLKVNGKWYDHVLTSKINPYDLINDNQA
ncbi:30S ribosomal protein S5 alanine N-acetyltransferase [Endozoicomonas sp. OPT23]|uniref:GNAT family N-acetyltransferase n=1 Tax=Endozoicomonas sp. OPT23 TaxID=2072845 RepID=UPI00129A3D1F|nr:GNAT family N-acetyltransferase [Endozoicomonas sp. OPT23]MRI34001.1 30S ribosomal protein S5 alanine N-acetyltransferase [Endozoicomonas sp. OPT23]